MHYSNKTIEDVLSIFSESTYDVAVVNTENKKVTITMENELFVIKSDSGKIAKHRNRHNPNIITDILRFTQGEPIIKIIHNRVNVYK